MRRTAGSERRGFLRMAVLQCGVLLTSGVVISLLDAVWGRSFLAGGAVALVPQLYFVLRATRRLKSRSPEAAARTAYAAAAGKFVLSAAGFAVVFASLRPVSGPAVFAGFLVLVITHLACSWHVMRESDTDSDWKTRKHGTQEL